MRNLGLDFGTTNSILSYLDQDTIHSFQLGGASTLPYIPSWLAIDKIDKDYHIGDEARSKQGDDEYQVFSRFKMLLAEQNKKRLKNYGFQQYKPIDIAREYIQRLLKHYEGEQRQRPEHLVITVPETWIREGSQQKARENLKQIAESLSVSSYRLLSEPVAACVYFAWRYQQSNQQDFQGHVLVCDYGGGTLDLSLSRVNGDHVTVLAGAGKGYSKNSLGQAGVAFDETVVKNLYQREKRALTPNNKNFFKHLREFENQKIANKATIDKRLRRYLQNNTANRKVFEMDGIAVMPSDLQDAFKTVNQPALQQALQQIKQELQTHRIDTENSKHFRIVMAGGFSNFYLVQQTVKDFFGGGRYSHDGRLDQLTLNDTALSISKGAALVANQRMHVESSCPMDVGFRAFGQDLQPYDETLLKKGTKLSQYYKVQYTNKWFQANDPHALKSASLRIFLEINQQKRYLNLKDYKQHNLANLLPNSHRKNQWKIGFSVDENLLFSLHAKDKNGYTQVTPLGELVTEIIGLQAI